MSVQTRPPRALAAPPPCTLLIWPGSASATVEVPPYAPLQGHQCCQTECERLYSTTCRPGAPKQPLLPMAASLSISESEISRAPIDGHGFTSTWPSGTSGPWTCC